MPADAMLAPVQLKRWRQGRPVAGGVRVRVDSGVAAGRPGVAFSRPQRDGCRCRLTEKRLGPFSLDNVTAVLPFMSGLRRCRHATQNPHNPQNRLANKVLRVVRVLSYEAEG